MNRFLCLVNTINGIRSSFILLGTSANIPAGCGRMRMDTPISTAVKTNSFPAEKEGFVCIFCKAENYGVAAVETGGNQLSTGHLNLSFKSLILAR